jgi:hypothetical protein
MKDYYSILEISQTSDKSEIQKAYRRLAKKYHPDINKAANAHDKFIEISEAYEFLIHQIELKNNGYSSLSDNAQENLSSELFREYERMQQAAREKAQKQAKMRYEELKKQHEAFLISGMHDLMLFFTIIWRLFNILLFLILFFSPIYMAFKYEWIIIFAAILFWPFAGIIAWNAFDNRRKYLKPGEFYYTLSRIKQIFTETKITEEKCYYCPSKSADSKPFKIEMLKIEDIQIKTSGFRQHNVNYKNKVEIVQIPRSRKAFIIHTVNIGVKLLSILLCLIFINISSLIWRFIFGMISSGMISSIISISTNTKSNVNYIFSIGILIRATVWIFLIISISEIDIDNLNIKTSDAIYFVIFAILFFDNVLMLVIDFLFGKYASKPIFKQHPELIKKFNEGYKVYNDILVISVTTPIYRWIFG